MCCPEIQVEKVQHGFKHPTEQLTEEKEMKIANEITKKEKVDRGKIT